MQRGNRDQKARHFKYFEMLDTLPVQNDANALAESNGTEHVLELNAAVAAANVIAWEDWWQLKEETNQ